MQKTLSGQTKSPQHVNMFQQKQPESLPLYIGANPRKQSSAAILPVISDVRHNFYSVLLQSTKL